MSNNQSASILPMPAAMAALPSGFPVTTEVLAGLARKMEPEGAFCDTVMGDNHPSMVDGRHDRITSDMCRSVRLQEALSQLASPPQGAPPADDLLTVAYYHIGEFCKAQVDHELHLCRTRLRDAIGYVDHGGEFEKVHTELSNVCDALQQAQESWSDLVQVGFSNQADANMRKRALELDLRNFVSSKVSQFQSRQNIKTGIASLQKRYQEKLDSTDGDVSMMDMVWLQNHNRALASQPTPVAVVTPLQLADSSMLLQGRCSRIIVGISRGMQHPIPIPYPHTHTAAW